MADGGTWSWGSNRIPGAAEGRDRDLVWDQALDSKLTTGNNRWSYVAKCFLGGLGHQGQQTTLFQENTGSVALPPKAAGPTNQCFSENVWLFGLGASQAREAYPRGLEPIGVFEVWLVLLAPHSGFRIGLQIDVWCRNWHCKTSPSMPDGIAASQRCLPQRCRRSPSGREEVTIGTPAGRCPSVD